MRFVLVSDDMKKFVVECIFWLISIDIMIREFFSVLKNIVRMLVIVNFMIIVKVGLLLLFDWMDL